MCHVHLHLRSSKTPSRVKLPLLQSPSEVILRCPIGSSQLDIRSLGIDLGFLRTLLLVVLEIGFLALLAAVLDTLAFGA